MKVVVRSWIMFIIRIQTVKIGHIPNPHTNFCFIKEANCAVCWHEMRVVLLSFHLFFHLFSPTLLSSSSICVTFTSPLYQCFLFTSCFNLFPHSTSCPSLLSHPLLLSNPHPLPFPQIRAEHGNGRRYRKSLVFLLQQDWRPVDHDDPPLGPIQPDSLCSPLQREKKKGGNGEERKNSLKLN